MRLDFKFREYVLPAQRKRVISEVKKLGAKRVEALFPGEKDAELASLYKAEGIPEGSSSKAIAKLGGLPEIEFAEQPAMYKLIR